MNEKLITGAIGITVVVILVASLLMPVTSIYESWEPDDFTNEELDYRERFSFADSLSLTPGYLNEKPVSELAGSVTTYTTSYHIITNKFVVSGASAWTLFGINESSAVTGTVTSCSVDDSGSYTYTIGGNTYSGEGVDYVLISDPNGDYVWMGLTNTDTAIVNNDSVVYAFNAVANKYGAGHGKTSEIITDFHVTNSIDDTDGTQWIATTSTIEDTKGAVYAGSMLTPSGFLIVPMNGIYYQKTTDNQVNSLLAIIPLMILVALIALAARTFVNKE